MKPLKKLAISSFCLTASFSNASAVLADPAFDMIRQETDRILRETAPLVRQIQSEHEQYNNYVYNHLHQACAAGDQTACVEAQCRHDDLMLRYDFAIEAVRSGHPPITFKHQCGPIRHRF